MHTTAESPPAAATPETRALPILLVLAGAGAYDLVHFSIYLWQIEAFGVPGFLYGVACAAALLVIFRWVAFELRLARPGGARV